MQNQKSIQECQCEVKKDDTSSQDDSSQNEQDEDYESSDKNVLNPVSQNSSQMQSRNFKNSRFIWSPNFAKNVVVDILETNFQSMKVQVHYGNYKLVINVIITKIKEQTIFDENFIGAGFFGRVYELSYDNIDYAIKVVKTKTGSLEWGTKDFYKQYFLCVFASWLETGPQVYPLFGYDIVFLENSALFVMEKCVKKKSYKISQMRTQLTSGLNQLHNFQFIHSDIKPENISYSQKKKKHIFLDFGLSKFILQERGQKTTTKFLGTLNYCSEQMKKCYILQHQFEVDLYFNDNWALQKTLEQTHNKFLKKDQKPFEIPVVEQVLLQQLQKKYQTLKNILEVLKLKFSIYEKNQIYIILQLKKCCSVLPKTCFQILSNMNVIQNTDEGANQISKIHESLKDKIYSTEFKLNEKDKIIQQFFNERIVEELFFEMIPIQTILKADMKSFKILFQNENWISKLFMIFDPFNEEGYQKNMFSLRIKIIEKIYTLAKETEKKKIFYKFLCFKTEFALKYFYEQKKIVQNPNNLISLRILFIATMSRFDEDFIKNIEDQILQRIDNINEKISKIIQFYYSWMIRKQGFPFEHKKLFQHIDIILSNKEEPSCQLERVLRNTLSEMMNNKDLFFKYSATQSKIYYLLLEIEKLCEDKKLYKINQVNKNMFYFLLSKRMRAEPKGIPSYLQLYVYLRQHKFCLNASQHDLAFNRKIEDFQRTFVSFAEYSYRGTNFTQIFHHFIVMTVNIGLQQDIILKFINCIYSQNLRIIQVSRMLLAQKLKEQMDLKEVFRIMNICSCMLGMIRQKFSQNRVSSEERKQMEDIRIQINQLHQKIKPYWKNTIYERLFNVKSIGLDIKFSNCKSEIQNLTVKLVSLIEPYFYKGLLPTILFYTTFLELKYEIFYNQNTLLTKIFDQTCQTILEKCPFLLTSDEVLLPVFLSLKKKQAKNQQGLKYFIKVLLYMEIHQSVCSQLFGFILKEAFTFFCQGQQKQFLFKSYFKFQSLKFDSPNIVFFKLFLYQLIPELFSKQYKMKILKKAVLALQYMHESYRQLVKIKVMSTAIELRLFRSKRQERIFHKKVNLYYNQCEYLSFYLKCMQAVNLIYNKNVHQHLTIKMNELLVP